MNKKVRVIIVALICIIVCTVGLFIYEVKKEHHYTPQTAEILLRDEDALKNAFMLKDDSTASFNIAEHITFVSDVENLTANLETRKKVFGFYECDINRVYDEYNPAVSYKSSDENIASVDENGVITAFKKGTAVITITGDEISIDVPVSVYKVVEVTELEQDVTLLKGESKNFIKLDEYEVVLSQFYSSDINIVTVDGNGTATAISKGRAEVYTYKDEDKTEKVSTQIVVKQPVESVSLNGLTLYTGESAALNVSYLPKNADYGTNFSYKSTAPSVASVSGNIVTAVNAGETVVTVTSGNGVTAQAKIVVLTPPKATPTVTTISKDEYNAYSGEKYSDGSGYASYFKITFDHPVIGFRINRVSDDGVNKTTGAAVYNNAQVPASTPLYFAVCINESDVLDTRGFSYTNRDGSKKYYSLHLSGRDGTVLMTEY